MFGLTGGESGCVFNNNGFSLLRLEASLPPGTASIHSPSPVYLSDSIPFFPDV